MSATLDAGDFLLKVCGHRNGAHQLRLVQTGPNAFAVRVIDIESNTRVREVKRYNEPDAWGAMLVLQNAENPEEVRLA